MPPEFPTYETIGFSMYLEKPVISGSAQTESPVMSRNINFDQSQMSGSLGDKIQVGPITIDGVNKRIIVSDGERDRILIGYDEGGF